MNRVILVGFTPGFMESYRLLKRRCFAKKLRESTVLKLISWIYFSVLNVKDCNQTMRCPTDKLVCSKFCHEKRIVRDYSFERRSRFSFEDLSSYFKSSYWLAPKRACSSSLRGTAAISGVATYWLCLLSVENEANSRMV